VFFDLHLRGVKSEIDVTPIAALPEVKKEVKGTETK
jgi:hypothetical protein